MCFPKFTLLLLRYTPVKGLVGSWLTLDPYSTRWWINFCMYVFGALSRMPCQARLVLAS
jgi:hypothetical protein